MPYVISPIQPPIFTQNNYVFTPGGDSRAAASRKQSRAAPHARPPTNPSHLLSPSARAAPPWSGGGPFWSRGGFLVSRSGPVPGVTSGFPAAPCSVRCTRDSPKTPGVKRTFPDPESGIRDPESGNDGSKKPDLEPGIRDPGSETDGSEKPADPRSGTGPDPESPGVKRGGEEGRMRSATQLERTLRISCGLGPGFRVQV